MKQTAQLLTVNHTDDDEALSSQCIAYSIALSTDSSTGHVALSVRHASASLV